MRDIQYPNKRRVRRPDIREEITSYVCARACAGNEVTSGLYEERGARSIRGRSIYQTRRLRRCRSAVYLLLLFRRAGAGVGGLNEVVRAVFYMLGRPEV